MNSVLNHIALLVTSTVCRMIGSVSVCKPIRASMGTVY